METLTAIKEIAIILLLVGTFGLCVIVAVGLARLFPHLRRAAENWANTTESTAKIAGDFAAVSADVAGDVQKTTASTAVGAEQLANTALATSKIAGDFAAISTDVAGDIRETAASTAEAAEHLKGTAKNVMESSVHLRNAMRLLKLLDPAQMANVANMGIRWVAQTVRDSVQRGRT